MKEESSTKTETTNAISPLVEIEAVLEIDTKNNTIFYRSVIIIGTCGDFIVASNSIPYEGFNTEGLAAFKSIQDFYGWAISLPQTSDYAAIKAKWIKIS